MYESLMIKIYRLPEHSIRLKAARAAWRFLDVHYDIPCFNTWWDICERTVVQMENMERIP